MKTLTSRARESRIRSILKAVSWRCVGTIDTFVVSFVVLTFMGVTAGNTAHAVRLSGGIACVEVITKILLYYLHERAWGRIRFGAPARAPESVAGQNDCPAGQAG